MIKSNSEKKSEIAGSVIMRTIIPKNLSTMLNFISVPISEIIQKKVPLSILISHIFGLTTSDIINNEDYKRANKAISDPNFWDDIEESYYYALGPPFEIFAREWFRGFRRWSRRNEYFRRESEVEGSMATDTILCQLAASSSQQSMSSSFFPFFQPFALPPLYSREFESSKTIFSKYEVSPELLSIAFQIKSSALYCNEKISSAAKGIYEYHVPFGQSPDTKSDTISNIIHTAKNVTVAPLVASGMGSATLISTGQYLLALECAATGAGSTLLLVATTTLADYIVNYVSKKRAQIENQNEELLTLI